MLLPFHAAVMSLETTAEKAVCNLQHRSSEPSQTPQGLLHRCFDSRECAYKLVINNVSYCAPDQLGAVAPPLYLLK